MSAAANIALYELALSQATPALTNLYNALKITLGDPPKESLRFFHQQAPTDMEKPYIVYSAVDGDPAKHLLGDSGLNQALYLFEVWGTNPLDHAEIAELLKQAFSGLINAKVKGVNFRSIFADTDLDGILFPVDNSQKGEYKTSANYRVTYATPKANVNTSINIT